MNLLMTRMLFTFPMLFLFGLNLHDKGTKSVNFREATDAYRK